MPDGEVLSGKEANARIEELLGLNCEQFRKIVMLAQGEFRKFLDASSREKQEIFRKIFQTDLYERFTARLGSRADEIKRAGESARQAALSMLEQLDWQDDPALQELVQAEYPSPQAVCDHLHQTLPAEQHKLELLQKELTLLETQLRRLDLEKAEELAQLFSTREQLQQTLAGLQAREPEMLALKQQLRRLETAAAILPSYTLLQDCRRQSQQKDTQLQQAKLQLQEHQAVFAQALQDFETLPQLNTQRDALYRQLQKNERDIHQLQKLEEIGQRIVEEKKALSLAKRSAALSQLLLHPAPSTPPSCKSWSGLHSSFLLCRTGSRPSTPPYSCSGRPSSGGFRCRLPTWHSSCRRVSPVRSAAPSITPRPPRCRHPASRTSRSSS